MDANSFKTWIHRLEELTFRQREDLRRRLSEPQMSSGGLSPGLGIVPPTCCPHCQGQTYRSWGQSHGLPRYRCPRCSRTFNALSGTALARLRHRDLWSMHAIALIEGWSLRDEAKRLNINKNTAFLWRHRFIQQPAVHQAEHESGIVEADETFFLESFKGQRQLSRPARVRGGVASKRGISAEQIPVLVVRDRSGHTADFVLARLDSQHVTAALRPLIDSDAILCSDSAGVYSAFARETGIIHHAINVRQGQRVIDKVFHIQNVNAYDSRLKNWIRRFHGVATKYLPHYLGWRRLLERYRDAISPDLCIKEALGRPLLQQVIGT